MIADMRARAFNLRAQILPPPPSHWRERERERETRKRGKDMAPPPPANAPDGAAARRVPASTSPTLEAEVRVAAFDRHQCDVVVREELGRGANNRAYAAAREDDDDGTSLVLRAPRRRSDTQQKGSALWELRHTLRAAEIGVAPAVHGAWYARHARGEWTSGLYLLCERFPHDLETVLVDTPELRNAAIARADALGAELSRCLRALAEARLFVYDLKASNVVLRFGADGGVVARIIDFGRDFSEWDDEAVRAAAADARAPCIAMARALVARRWPDADAATRDAVLTHALHATMMVVLSATLTRTLHEERDRHRMGAAERLSAHPLAQPVNALLDDTRGCDLAVVRALLRHDEVRSVLRHYHGRRSAGTRRTLALARGREVP